MADNASATIRNLAISVTILVLAAACSNPERTPWSQPGSGAAPKPTDTASCRADANRRAEREYLLDTQSRGGDAFAAPGSLQNELARRDARRYRDRLYEECMRSLGYQRGSTDRFRAR